jgi:predicted HAD superfamily Cof-like phosphohydrolase
MTNPFRDQEKFMKASGQTTGEHNPSQYMLYYNLVREEMTELYEAMQNNEPADQLDALIDIIVVAIGAMHSMGVDTESAWKEVMSTNFAKIDKETGKVVKRPDGKILKPEGWTPPNLKQFIKGYPGYGDMN